MLHNTNTAMKILSALIVGFILGLISLIALPQWQQYLPELASSNANAFNDLNEGKKLQTIEDLPEDQYRTTSGNEASLFQLDNQTCKIKISLIGETYFAYRVVYFHDLKLLSLIENEYRTSWTQPVQVDFENEKSALYTSQSINTHSALAQSEFNNLIKKFNPALIKKY